MNKPLVGIQKLPFYTEDHSRLPLPTYPFERQSYWIEPHKSVESFSPLDFCLLTSSLSSILGGLGFIAYSAANRFMDAFTHQHNQTNRTP